VFLAFDANLRNVQIFREVLIPAPTGPSSRFIQPIVCINS
jgi:hypothetical protein